MNETQKSLADLKVGQKAIIVLPPEPLGLGLRLREMGFVAEAELEILAEAPFGADPLLIRIHGTRVAMRRADARPIRVMVL